MIRLRVPRWLWRTGAWWTLAAVAACGGGDGNGGTGPGGGDALAGTYQLVGANDQAVPALITFNVCTPTQIVAGEMSLTAGGRWEMRFDWRGDGGQQYTGDHGRYRRDGDTMLFTSEAWGDQFEGEVDGDLVWFYYDFCNEDQGHDLDLAWSR